MAVRALAHSASLRIPPEHAARAMAHSASARGAVDADEFDLLRAPLVADHFARDAQSREQRQVARDTRSPSTSTISSASRSWHETPQVPIAKQPSLPVPATPADARPLPSCNRPTRIPKAQVFLARPMTPRAIAHSASARRPPRPAAGAAVDGPRGMGSRCVSDYAVVAGQMRASPRGRQAELGVAEELEVASPRLRRSSSARASTPAPDFWKKTAGMSFEMLHDEEMLHEQPFEKVRPESPVEVSAFDFDTEFAGSDMSMHSEPPSASNAAVFGDDVRSGFLNSLRNLNFRRNRKHDPWNVPEARAPTPRIVELFTGGGNPYTAASKKGFDARPRGGAPRVFSFDPYRTRQQPGAGFRRGKRQAFGDVARGRVDDVVRRAEQSDRLSMHGDEYVGFMGVVPSRRELVKVKSRKWWGRLLGRREMNFD